MSEKNIRYPRTGDIDTCDGLNENGPCTFIYLSTWSSAGGTVWEELGGAALMKEVCHWGQALRF